MTSTKQTQTAADLSWDTPGSTSRWLRLPARATPMVRRDEIRLWYFVFVTFLPPRCFLLVWYLLWKDGWMSVTRRYCVKMAKPILKTFSTLW